jgi:hypothetical protein
VGDLLLLSFACVTILQSNYNDKEDLLFLPLYLSSIVGLYIHSALHSDHPYILSGHSQGKTKEKHQRKIESFSVRNSRGFLFDDGAF